MKTKNIWLVVLVVAFSVNVEAIAQKMVDDYSMVFALSMTAEKGKEKALEGALKAHNAKFHPEGSYFSWVRQIVAGANTGDYVWFMGPLMYRNMDSRPELAGHDEDWSKTIDPYVAEYGASEYWKKDDKLSYAVPNQKAPKFYGIWIIDVTKGKWETFNGLIEKIVAVYKKEGKDSMSLYKNEFSSGDGRDVALVWGFDTWSELDEDDPMKAKYETMYGKDSWATFMESWTSSIDKITQSIHKDVK